MSSWERRHPACRDRNANLFKRQAGCLRSQDSLIEPGAGSLSLRMNAMAEAGMLGGCRFSDARAWLSLSCTDNVSRAALRTSSLATYVLFGSTPKCVTSNSRDWATGFVVPFRSPAFRRKRIHRNPKLRKPLFRLKAGLRNGTTKLFTRSLTDVEVSRAPASHRRLPLWPYSGPLQRRSQCRPGLLRRDRLPCGPLNLI